MNQINNYFGEMVFDDREMQKRLIPEVYAAIHRTTAEGHRLDLRVANAVASAMRDWALEKGATHYTHWFQPMTGVTAEKHDSFVEPGKNGGVLLEFSGKELIQGEPDASSFPSGGLRATFEARGYTVWDATSYAFIKDGTLCIPTAFCSFNGDALDQKTPLLRSMESLNKQALRIMKLFGNDDVKRVTASVGAEQEYFLIDKDMFLKRKDLVYTGRTLFGARPSKGEEMDDHYFGVIPPRVQAFMKDLNRELWRLGILAKTEHNEVAPGQHELACIYSTASMATDQNQLVMEMMQKIAEEHDMVCLLHEKPFEGVSGSGKHNNWSIATDTGQNLLSPGETPAQNARFLLFFVAVIRAVNEYQDLLRISVAAASNDYRLGASEAPPAVMSMFLGSELTSILESIENDQAYNAAEKTTLKLGVHALPRFQKDTTDRNRTSPFAFTGNKFEFRSVGSSNSIACANIMLNAAVAAVLKDFADELEQASDFDAALHEIIKRTIHDHKRIIFNDNGYDEAWLKEAVEVRGLSNYKTTPDALPHMLDEKNVQMLTDMKVFSENELKSRVEVRLENYTKTVEIEARTMVTLTRKRILPAVEKYVIMLADGMEKKKRVSDAISTKYEEKVITRLSECMRVMDEKTEEMLVKLDESYALHSSYLKAATLIRDEILPLMAELRKAADEAETMTAKEFWPFPTYGDIFFSVH